MSPKSSPPPPPGPGEFPAVRLCLPLKIGVTRDLIAAGVPEEAAVAFMAAHCRSEAYFKACAAKKAVRYALDGTPVGKVTEEERRYALYHLNEIKRAREREKWR